MSSNEGPYAIGDKVNLLSVDSDTVVDEGAIDGERYDGEEGMWFYDVLSHDGRRRHNGTPETRIEGEVS